jgi:hypothetical protein
MLQTVHDRSFFLSITWLWHIPHLSVGHLDQLDPRAVFGAAHSRWRRDFNPQLAPACKPRQ